MNLGASPNSFDQSSQPDGVHRPEGTRAAHGVSSPDQAVLAQHARLVELEPSAAARAELLKVTVDVDSAWQEGRMLPVLRSRRKALESAIASLEYAAGSK